MIKKLALSLLIQLSASRGTVKIREAVSEIIRNTQTAKKMFFMYVHWATVVTYYHGTGTEPRYGPNWIHTVYKAICVKHQILYRDNISRNRWALK